MLSVQKLEIVSTENISHIYIDGKEIHDVTGASLELKPGRPSELHLSLFVDGVSGFWKVRLCIRRMQQMQPILPSRKPSK